MPISVGDAIITLGWDKTKFDAGVQQIQAGFIDLLFHS